MQMGADLVAQHATKALMFCCLSADKVDPVHGKALPKCGKGSETCGGYWNPVEGHWKGWGTPETVADMWNVWKRVKIYQKHKQWQCCTSPCQAFFFICLSRKSISVHLSGMVREIWHLPRQGNIRKKHFGCRNVPIM